MNFLPCPRCEGQMTQLWCCDFFLVFWAWKCVQCGEIIDKVIVKNRRKMLEAKKSGKEMVGDEFHAHHKGDMKNYDGHY